MEYITAFVSYFLRIPLVEIRGWTSKQIKEQYYSYGIIGEKVKEANEDNGWF